MENIFDLLTSRARVLVLRTLYFQGEAIPLRHLSEISGLPVFSVQNAVASLVDERLVQRTDKGNNALFAIDREHPLFATMEKIFIVEMENRIRLEALSMNLKARQVLKFAAAAGSIFRRAKRKGR